jgi:hypothetical protein
MDSLIIQDVFDPYYCDRKPFACRRPKALAKTRSGSKAAEPAEPGPSRPDIEVGMPANQAMTTEH